MAGFREHITTSTVLGVAYGGAGLAFGMPIEQCLLATGLCSVSGMLPDLDSDSGKPLQEMLCFASAAVPLMLFDRFEQMGFSHEMIILISGILYLILRFGVGNLFKKYTVHRGMFHSVPAAAVVGLLTYLSCSCTEMDSRLFKSMAVVAGFMSHLVLDEIWSIDTSGGGFRLKSSSGTAIKFFGNKPWANFSVYAKLGLLLVLVFADPVTSNYFGYEDPGVAKFAKTWFGIDLQREGPPDHSHDKHEKEHDAIDPAKVASDFTPPALSSNPQENRNGSTNPDDEWVGVKEFTVPTLTRDPQEDRSSSTFGTPDFTSSGTPNFSAPNFSTPDSNTGGPPSFDPSKPIDRELFR